MPDLATPAARSQIRAAHITNTSALLLGTANYGQRVQLTQKEDATNYTNTFGNVDTTNGRAVKIQYGPAATPTTIATFDKNGMTATALSLTNMTMGATGKLNSIAAAIPLQELASQADSPLGVALVIDNNFEAVGITRGSLSVGELGSPMVNLQKIMLPNQSGTVDNDQYAAGGYGAPLYVGSSRLGSNLLATTAVVSATANTVTCAAGTFTAGMVGGEMDIVSGTGSTVAIGLYQPRLIASINGDGSTATLNYNWYTTPDATSSIVVNSGGAISSQSSFFLSYADTTASLGSAIKPHHIAAQFYSKESVTNTACPFGVVILSENRSASTFTQTLELDVRSLYADAPAYTTAGGFNNANRILALSSGGSYLSQVGIHFTAVGATSAMRNGMVFAAASVADNCINFAPLVGGGTGPYRTRDGAAFSHVAKDSIGNDMVWLSLSSNALTLANNVGGITIGATKATGGLTVSQNAADDFALQMQSTDVGHGVATIGSITSVPTSTYGFDAKVSATGGGRQIAGVAENATVIGLELLAVGDTNTTHSTAGTGYITLTCYENDGTATAASPTADSNLLAVRAGTTTRFMLDADGDSHQDVGTAWTNFDDYDDAALLTALSVGISKAGDPLREQFGHILTDHQDALARARIVSFNDDGHHFVNMSRLTMLLVGAVRQLSDRLSLQDAQLSALGAGSSSGDGAP